MERVEYPYILAIETARGVTHLPVAFLTRKEIEDFLQSDFKRLVEQAGLNGVRIHVERAPTADYQKVLGEVGACLQTAGRKAA